MYGPGMAPFDGCDMMKYGARCDRIVMLVWENSVQDRDGKSMNAFTFGPPTEDLRCNNRNSSRIIILKKHKSEY